MAGVSTDTLLACLDDIRARRRTLEQCVAAHPDAANELRALAGMVDVLRLDGTPHISPDARQHGRAQLLAAIQGNGHQPKEDRAVLAGWLDLRRRWMAALGAGLAALTAGGAVVYAAQGAPPDSPLYPVRSVVQVVSDAVALPSPTPTFTATTLPTAMPTVAATSNAGAIVSTPTEQPTPPARVAQNPAASAASGVERKDDPESNRDQGGSNEGRGRSDARDSDQSAPTVVASPSGRGEARGRDQNTPTSIRGGDEHRVATAVATPVSNPGRGQQDNHGRGGGDQR